jgi:cyclic nucleotide gated channel
MVILRRNYQVANIIGYMKFLTQTDLMFTWHVIFLVSCAIAIQCVDPLFLYLPLINQNDKCLMLDRRLTITAICLRSVFDLFYVANIILGYFRRRYHDNQQPRQIINQYLMSRLAIFDILAILPIPQVRT